MFRFVFALSCILSAAAHAVSVERLDPRLDQIIRGEVAVDTVAKDQTWTEGPLALPDGRLLFADIKTNSVREIATDGAVHTLLAPSGYQGRTPYPGPEPGSSAMALDHAGRVVTAGHAGRSVWRFTRAGGPIPGKTTRTVLVSHFKGKPLNSPNDIVVAADGSIYFTDPPFGLPTQKPNDPWQRLPGAGIFRIQNPGLKTQRLERVSTAVPGPNGLAFSPDQKWLYVADTPNKRWVKLAVAKDGALGAPVDWATTGEDHRPGEPDGLKVDARGNIFAAGPGGVWVFAPDGTHLGTIPLPKKTSNVAWARDQRALYVTASDVIYRLSFSAGDTAGSSAPHP